MHKLAATNASEVDAMNASRVESWPVQVGLGTGIVPRKKSLGKHHAHESHDDLLNRDCRCPDRVLAAVDFGKPSCRRCCCANDRCRGRGRHSEGHESISTRSKRMLVMFLQKSPKSHARVDCTLFICRCRNIVSFDTGQRR